MYIIQEIQTSNNQTALVPAATFLDRNEAESNYHMKLGAAAISAVQVHTVIMYDEHGNMLRREYYEHLPQEEQDVHDDDEKTESGLLTEN